MPSEPLTSWKAIAAVFGRDVRTVQRWEKEEGLPVQRHLHQRRASVYADRETLEAWWHQHREVTDRPDPVPPVPQAAPPASEKSIGTRMRSVVMALAAVGTVLIATATWLRVERLSEAGAALAVESAVLNGARAGAGLMGGAYGDLNGDGRADVVAAAPAAREAYIFLRLPATTSSVADSADTVVTGTDNAQLFAETSADFNGDGIDDLLFCTALSEPDTYSGTGASYIVLGRRQWPRRIELPGQADVTITLPYPSDARISASIRSHPDLDADGLDDVVLLASEYGSSDRRSAGAVIVLRGRRAWPARVDAVTEADVFILGSRAGEGLASAAIGDFDGDRTRDLAVLAKESTIFNLRGGAGRGYVFRGPVAGRLDAARDFRVRIDGARPSATVPLLAGADVNGDGTADFIVSRPGEAPAAGEVRIWLGGTQRAGTVAADPADVTITGDPAFGGGLTTADLDGDGAAELLVSDGDRGLLVLICGRTRWSAAGSWRDHDGQVLFDRAAAGPQQASVADVDGDRLPEIVLTTAGDRVGSLAAAGRVRVLKPFRPVRLDVRPGFEPNVVLVPNWILVARLYGVSGDPADDIDPASIRLHGAAARSHVVEDYDGDGAPDVQAMFDTGDMRLRPDETLLAVTARTRRGVLLGGSDAVVVRPLGGT